MTAVEPRKQGNLDEEVIKQMTGGDVIRARDIYQSDVIFYPEFKLWLAMNNKPRITGTTCQRSRGGLSCSTTKFPMR